MRISLLLSCLLCLPLALGVTISGTIYDLGLDEVHDAIVTVDTSPEQRIVAKDGTYSFTVPTGDFEISAIALIDGEEWVAKENITVASEGAYTFDLLLTPSFSEIDDLAFEEEALPELADDTPGALVPILSLVIGAALLLFISIFYIRKLRPRKLARAEKDEFRSAILSALRKHGGRITQKDLRRELPFSEAKVSLVLTELEHEGAIEKIRKGRGNVIVKR